MEDVDQNLVPLAEVDAEMPAAGGSAAFFNSDSIPEDSDSWERVGCSRLTFQILFKHD